ncbi:hypothetical protein BC826DRAFT_1092769 [Russula brevipes]|nr:hypothetical protein BC826DRAFT_1092769 [Russula brevipes]
MVAVEEETDELRNFARTGKGSRIKTLRSRNCPPEQASTSDAGIGVLRSRNDALEAYTRAIKHEQVGELDDALRLYRQAFRMDSNVDRAYHHQNALAATPLEKRMENNVAVLVDSGSETVAPVVAHARPLLSVNSHPDRQVAGLLAGIVVDFPTPLAFEPEDERVPLPLQRLPDELILYILSYLGYVAIECFARVSRKARMITLDATIWRSFVESTYRPPQISPDEVLDDIVEKHSSDYRRVYIERPRVRLDGVYIAVCHYIRPGMSENAWVNVGTFIHTSSFRRFYPNGQVISLLTNEEHEPQHIITVLRPTLRMKGFYTGTWMLSGLTVHVSNLVDPSNPTTRYSFKMTLTLRSRPLGRWNKLEFNEYESINIADGEAAALSLKNERPFWFSKVRSYGSRIE